MLRRLAAALSLSLLPMIASCSPAEAPPPANATTNAAADELLDTSPDSLAAPDDANGLGDTETATENSVVPN